MAGVHEDFGEKIGGAKKDLWKDRGLYADDLEAMNEREAEKFVKKDNVWKKPDYAAMLEEGIPLGVVYFIKKARDGLNASPQYYRTDDTPEKRTARQKEYIKTVRELQTVLSDVRTVEDAIRAYDRFFADNGYLEKVQGWGSGIHYRATKKGQDNPVITNKLSNTMLIRSAEYFERNFAQKAKKEQFCVSKEQKIPKGYAIHFNDGKQTYSKNEDWKPGTYYVTKGYSILRTNFETKEAALKWVQELAKGRNKNGKIRFVPPQLAHVKRTGPDYRNGVEITGQHYLDTFGFRGGEFGNWMNQNDRQTSLNMGFEALKDLASALKISDKDIAYQGTLAIAFGARGSGNAAAHYEPLRTVINLTKMHGAGSLAHEWWHGLDDYLGTKMGAKGMLSEQPHLYAPFQKLIDTMKYKPETPEQAAKRTEAQTERTRKNAASWLDSSVLASLKRYGNEEQMETYAVLREAFLSGEPGSVEQISAFKKNVTGRVIPKSERERLEIFERMLSGMQAQEAPQIGRTETDFYRNSVRMGKECEKDGGYWDSNVEMTARAFACYERMVNIVSSRFRHGPKTEERAIDEAMQKVISEKYLMLPLYLYDHSGLAMSTESFSGRAPHAEWDSGQVGWIYVSKEDALKEFDADKMTGAIRQKADALMRSEVAAYDSYLHGECYGFELYKNGELSDSCWGFMGNFSDVLKDMAEYLPDECKGMVDHLEEQERPATIIKTLLKHAKIQVDQAAKAFEHASRQQVLGESR